MPSISDRLKALGVQVGASKIPPRRDSPSRSHLVEILDGSWEENSRGDCFVVRKSLPYSAPPGNKSGVFAPDLSIFDSLKGLQGITSTTPEHFLFIDTETTSLAGGAGSYVFLIGAARVSSSGVELAQFFLPEPALESSQLAALELFSASSQVLVSYNGKSFDLPRINQRYAFHGWPPPFDDVLHLDLLHIARRLWARHLDTCTLGEIENRLLDVTRSELDIPGWQVSQAFFDYLQNDDPEPLRSVFYHNEIDVLSLIALTEYIANRLSQPDQLPGAVPGDLVSIGKYLAEIQQADLAEVALINALSDHTLSDELHILGTDTLAAIYKKQGIYDQALPLWEKAARKGSLSAMVELAKHHEHKSRDLEEALHWTLSALSLNQPPGKSIPGCDRPALEHRLQRVKSKLARG